MLDCRLWVGFLVAALRIDGDGDGLTDGLVSCGWGYAREDG